MASNADNQPLSRRSYNSGRRKNTDGSIAYDPRQTTQAYAQPENGIPAPVRGIRRSGADAGYQPAIQNKAQAQPLRTAQPSREDIRSQAQAAIGKARPDERIPVPKGPGLTISRQDYTIPGAEKISGWSNVTGGDFGDYVRTPEGEQVGKASATKDASGAWRRIGAPGTQPTAPQADPMRAAAHKNVPKGYVPAQPSDPKATTLTGPTPDGSALPGAVRQSKINGQPTKEALHTAKADANFATMVTPAMARDEAKSNMLSKVMPGGKVDDAALMREAAAKGVTPGKSPAAPRPMPVPGIANTPEQPDPLRRRNPVA